MRVKIDEIYYNFDPYEENYYEVVYNKYNVSGFGLSIKEACEDLKLTMESEYYRLLEAKRNYEINKFPQEERLKQLEMDLR